MKSIVKALSKPFKTTKSQKSNSQKEIPDSKDSNLNQLENNIQFKDGAAKVQARFNFLYSQVQKMVDQLGTALHFKEKMTEEQKRQLIYQLSSMAMNENKAGTQLMDEDVLSADDEEQDNYIPTEVKSFEVVRNCTFKETQCQAMTQSSMRPTSKSLVSPEKDLKDLFQEFQRNQQESSTMQTKQNVKEELSTYGEIKSRIGSFFIKNSSKVLKFLKSKSAQSEKVSKQIQGDGNFGSQTELQLNKKQKKKWFISSILPSWNAKKENKYGSISSSTIVQSKVIAQL